MIKNTRRNVFWPTHVKREGEIVAIRDIINDSKAALFIAGTAAEGWAVYLEPVDDTLDAQQVSPLFSPEAGEKLAELREAAHRAYGVKDLPKVSDHPPEKWIWQTVEAPEERATRVKNKAVAIVGSAKRRFGDDVAGMLEWLDTERVQHTYIAANTGNWIVRDEENFMADATSAAIVSIRADQTPAQARDISAEDDIAFWALEACKRQGVPLYDNLDIPADVAEDIDAANWSAGIGLKDTTARRELFREKRAEAYARMYPDHAAELAAEKAAEEAPDLLTAVKICLDAEEERRASLKPGAPATTYTEKHIAMLKAAVARAEAEPKAATDPRTGRPIGDHGTGEQAIDWILHHADARLQASDFLNAWQEGDVFEEWPEFYEWLTQAEQAFSRP